MSSFLYNLLSFSVIFLFYQEDLREDQLLLMLKQAEENRDLNGISTANNNLGNLYMRKGMWCHTQLFTNCMLPHPSCSLLWLKSSFVALMFLLCVLHDEYSN